MSVLSVPRLFFKGVAAWHPATMNNNDHWSVYDYVNADLNWEFFRNNPDTQHFTPGNVRQEIPRWARKLREFEDTDDKGNVKGRWQEPPARWDYYGGMEWAFHSEESATHITGAQTEFGGPVQGDGLVGAVIDVVGDPFPGRSFPTPARMTDTNPNSFWSSNFYARRFQIGTPTAPERYLSGQVAPGTYMNTRWLNFQRNLNRDGRVQIAGVASGLFQVCLPKEVDGRPLRINSDESKILGRFEEELKRPSVRGLMIRCTAYLTRYFTLPEFRDCYDSDPYLWNTKQFARLVQMWNDDLVSGRTPTQNPAVSRLVGTVGLWTGDDPWVTAPGGRHLLPNETFTPGGKPRQVVLGAAAVETHVNGDPRYAAIDLGSTVPEVDSTAQKEDLGTLRLMLRQDSGLTCIGEIDRSRYDQAAYERTAGIVDVPIPHTLSDEDLADGTLEIHRAVDGKILLREREFTVETDDRSLYVDEPLDETTKVPEKSVVRVQVREKGKVPSDTVYLDVVEYRPDPPPPAPDSGRLKRVEVDEEIFPDLPSTLAVTKGEAELEIPAPDRPGLPVIAFFPPGEQAPEFLGPVAFGQPTAGTASYCNVRALPFDNALPREFRDMWRREAATNLEHAKELAWKVLYEKVLCVYDVLYPTMKYVAHLDLGDRRSVEDNIDLIVELAERELLETHSTLYMPVSRELSEGKRTMLNLYQILVNSGWAPDALDEE